MKNYYYLETKRVRQNSGYSVTVRVFTAIAGKIKEIGKTKWNTASTRGERSEIYGFLYAKNLVTRKDFEAEKGYYYASKAKVTINEL